MEMESYALDLIELLAAPRIKGAQPESEGK